MPKSFNIQKIEAHFKQVLLYAPGMMGNHAVNFFLDRFKQQNWVGNTVQPWQKRRPQKKRNGRAILVDSGRLRRSVKITKIQNLTTHIGSDVPYAKAHNDGFKGTVNVPAHTRKVFGKRKVESGKLTKKGKMRMRSENFIKSTVNVKAHSKKMRLPQRKFMGNSPVLQQQLERMLKAEFMKGNR